MKMILMLLLLLFSRFLYTNSVLVYWVVWFYLHTKPFTNLRDLYVFVYVVTFDIRVDLTFKMTERKCEKNVRDREYARNFTDGKEATISHYGLFKL